MVRTLSQIIGANFAARRRALGLRQRDVAIALGYERRWISELEHGRKSLPLEMSPIVEQALRLSSVIELLEQDRFSG